MVVWADFIGGARARDNELSVHFWADGVDYVKSSGYWPYGHPSESIAKGWLGSNAPHLVGEAPGSNGEIHHRGSCAADGYWFIDLERTNTKNNTAVRRQVIGLGIYGNMLLDTARSHGNRNYQSVWRLDPKVQLVGPGGELLQPGMPHSEKTHTVVIGGADATVSLASGSSSSPEVQKVSASASRHRIYPLPTYVVSSDVSSPTLVSFEPNITVNNQSFSLKEFESPEEWTIAVGSGGLSLIFQRNGLMLQVDGGDMGLFRSYSIKANNAVHHYLIEMEEQFIKTAQKVEVFKSWMDSVSPENDLCNDCNISRSAIRSRSVVVRLARK